MEHGAWQRRGKAGCRVVKEGVFLRSGRTGMAEAWGALPGAGGEVGGWCGKLRNVGSHAEFEMLQTVGKPEGGFLCLCLLEKHDWSPLALLPRIHQAGIENWIKITLRTYSELFLLKSRRVFLPCAPVAKTKRNLISIAKANKRNKAGTSHYMVELDKRSLLLPLYNCACPRKVCIQVSILASFIIPPNWNECINCSVVIYWNTI